MADGTHISWSDATWNPVTGCTKVSAGCDHCYIDRTPPFRMQGRRFDRHGVGGTTGVLLHPDRLVQPLRWQKPRRIFVNSLSDLFHDSVPDEYLVNVFAVMAATPQHTYQVLTKRPARMRSFLRDLCRCGVGHPPGVHLSSNVSWALTAHNVSGVAGQYPKSREAGKSARWPLPNVWLGVSTEDQKAADLRIPILLNTPAAVRWISAEPLLGPVDLDQPRCDVHDRDEVVQDEAGREWCGECAADGFSGELSYGHWLDPLNGGLQWVVAGGESGPGARPAHPDWFRSLRDQCAAAGVPFHFKQWGEWAPTGIIGIGFHPDITPTGIIRQPPRPDPNVRFIKQEPFTEVNGLRYSPEVRRVGKKAAGRELDGVTHDAYPEPRTAGAR